MMLAPSVNPALQAVESGIPGATLPLRQLGQFMKAGGGGVVANDRSADATMIPATTGITADQIDAMWQKRFSEPLSVVVGATQFAARLWESSVISPLRVPKI